MKFKSLSIIVMLLFLNFTGQEQQVQMRVCKNDGSVHIFNISEIRKLTFDVMIGINNSQINAIIKKISSLKAFPNPFQNSTMISYSLPSEGFVEIAIVDLNGQTLKTFPRGNQSPGTHILNWDGTSNNGKKVQAGMYCYRVKFNNEVQTKKLVIIN